MKALFMTVFFAMAVVAVGMMMLGMCENPTPVVAQDLSIEEENDLLSQVEFNLNGTPAGETAVFLGDTIVSRLSPGDTTRVSIDGSDRCNLVLKIRDASGEWQFVKALGCIDHAPYAGVSFDVEGYEARTSWHAWK